MCRAAPAMSKVQALSSRNKAAGVHSILCVYYPNPNPNPNPHRPRPRPPRQIAQCEQHAEKGTVAHYLTVSSRVCLGCRAEPLRAAAGHHDIEQRLLLGIPRRTAVTADEMIATVINWCWRHRPLRRCLRSCDSVISLMSCCATAAPHCNTSSGQRSTAVRSGGGFRIAGAGSLQSDPGLLQSDLGPLQSDLGPQQSDFGSQAARPRIAAHPDPRNFNEQHASRSLKAARCGDGVGRKCTLLGANGGGHLSAQPSGSSAPSRSMDGDPPAVPRITQSARGVAVGPRKTRNRPADCSDPPDIRRRPTCRGARATCRGARATLPAGGRRSGWRALVHRVERRVLWFQGTDAVQVSRSLLRAIIIS